MREEEVRIITEHDEQDRNDLSKQTDVQKTTAKKKEI